MKILNSFKILNSDNELAQTKSETDVCNVVIDHNAEVCKRQYINRRLVWVIEVVFFITIAISVFTHVDTYFATFIFFLWVFADLGRLLLNTKHEKSKLDIDDELESFDSRRPT